MLKLGTLILVAVIAASASILAAPTSQPPIPSALKATQPKQQQPASEPSVTQQDYAPTNKGAAIPNLTFSPKIAVETDNPASGSKQESSADWWLVAFTAGLLIVAVVTYFTFRRQADIADATLAEMKRAADAQAKVTDQQLKIAKDTADAAKESADGVVTQLRAYTSIKVTEGMPPRFDPVTGPWIALTISNNGQTPAYEMAQWLRIAIAAPGFEDELPGMEEDVPPHPMTLAPGMSIQIVSEGPIPEPGVANAFALGQFAAYVYGEIRFIDAFKEQRFHRFRYFYTAADIQGGVMGMHLSRVGNEAN